MLMTLEHKYHFFIDRKVSFSEFGYEILSGDTSHRLIAYAKRSRFGFTPKVRFFSDRSDTGWMFEARRQQLRTPIDVLDVDGNTLSWDDIRGRSRVSAIGVFGVDGTLVGWILRDDGMLNRTRWRLYYGNVETVSQEYDPVTLEVGISWGKRALRAKFGHSWPYHYEFQDSTTSQIAMSVSRLPSEDYTEVYVEDTRLCFVVAAAMAVYIDMNYTN